MTCIFFYLVFFHKHSQFTGQQEKGEAISLTPLYLFHLLHRHLIITWAIAAESSPLHISTTMGKIFEKNSSFHVK